jgi:serine phosphatase RsbU (regulator of sigma subunit)/anti-sigma regulatory factor (Ser/Thr protein kinase)
MASRSIEERLSNLAAVTDVSLTKLDVDDLLVELLDRVRAVLDADTAAVLLRQHGSNDLIARAACGLEEEVRQGVRVPIGTGFAGTIAARREPVVLDRVDETTVANPILWERRIHHMVGVPLIVGDELLGVLHVGRIADRAFEPHDVELLQVAGERISAAVQTRRTAIESAAGAVLERELLPTRLPNLPGLEFAARYAPAEDRSIGGDWYDAFVLPSGALWIVIGDVAGHGLHSAVVVSRVKSALRSYALLDEPVSRVMERTNRKLLHFEVDTMVTLLCAVAEPPYDRFVIGAAGHPPPILATRDGAEFVPITPGPPLGAVDGAQYPAITLAMPDGGTLICYTDGLIERREESIESGLARLLATVASGAPERVCRHVMMRMVGDTPTTDDVALLVVRREAVGGATSAHDGEQEGASHPEEKLVGEIRLQAEKNSVAQARRFATELTADLDPAVRGVLVLLVSEVATNCVTHAATDFTVKIFRSSRRLRVECTDYAEGAVRVARAEPTDTHGRGVYFVVRLADDWGVRPSGHGIGKTVWFSLSLDTVPAEAQGLYRD